MSQSKNQKKINPYTLRLLKTNFGYIVALLFFLLIMVIFVPQYVTKYFSLRTQLKTTNTEIKSLEKRIAVLDTYDVTGLDDLIVTLNSIYPAVEDRFSIFTAVDNLTSIMGLQIISSSSPFGSKNDSIVSISVSAIASEERMRFFLRDYFFKTGRLMTIDNLSYDKLENQLNFTANFHSLSIDLGNAKLTETSADSLEFAQRIKKELETAGLQIRQVYDDDDIPTNYGTKSNPFE